MNSDVPDIVAVCLEKLQSGSCRLSQTAGHAGAQGVCLEEVLSQAKILQLGGVTLSRKSRTSEQPASARPARFLEPERDDLRCVPAERASAQRSKLQPAEQQGSQMEPHSVPHSVLMSRFRPSDSSDARSDSNVFTFSVAPHLCAAAHSSSAAASPGANSSDARRTLDLMRGDAERSRLMESRDSNATEPASGSSSAELAAVGAGHSLALAAPLNYSLQSAFQTLSQEYSKYQRLSLPRVSPLRAPVKAGQKVIKGTRLLRKHRRLMKMLAKKNTQLLRKAMKQGEGRKADGCAATQSASERDGAQCDDQLSNGILELISKSENDQRRDYISNLKYELANSDSVVEKDCIIGELMQESGTESG